MQSIIIYFCIKVYTSLNYTKSIHKYIYFTLICRKYIYLCIVLHLPLRSQLDPDIITYINQLESQYHYSIGFVSNNQITQCKLNASSNIRPFIFFYHSWYAHLSTFGNQEDTINAFVHTLGHELGHKHWDSKESFHYRYHNVVERQYINWYRELHHDYYGSNIMGGESKRKRENLIKSHQYKQYYNTEFIHRMDEDTISHPSRCRRIQYIANYDFTYDLLRQIAVDVGLIQDSAEGNHKLIEQVSDYYDEIILT